MSWISQWVYTRRYCVMAALIKRGLLENSQKLKLLVAKNYSVIDVFLNRPYSKKIKPRPRPPFITRSQFSKAETIEPTNKSIASKGFLRPSKPYSPPNNAAEKLRTISKVVLGKEMSLESQILDPQKRFELFHSCLQEFKHGIPNSLLHTMETLGDVQRFYETPVNSVVPLDTMKNVDLPPNLHIQYEYHRFHPETDTMFGGISAFPKSSTIVTGLKYKKKYRGHVAKTSWP